MEENKVYRQVLAYIEEGIKNGSITVGKRLPTEREIAGEPGFCQRSLVHSG